jgi:hypothetical protein
MCSPAIRLFSQLLLAVLLISLPHADTIKIEATGIGGCVIVYQKFFTHQSAVSPRKTFKQEIKKKHADLTLYSVLYCHLGSCSNKKKKMLF